MNKQAYASLNGPNGINGSSYNVDKHYTPTYSQCGGIVVGMGWFLEAGAEETWRKLQLLHRCEIYVCAAAALGLGRGTYLSPFVQRGKMVDHYPTVDLVSDRT